MSLERAENGAGAAQRRLKVGIAGLGAGAVQVVRALEHSPQVQLIAAADLRPEALATFQERYGGRGYDSVEKLCGDPDVEVIWISTPNQFHCEHTVLAAQHGKNIVVEKPMALSLAEAQRMVDAVEANGVRLLCGHTASLMAAYQAMRDVIRSEELGKVGAINILSYTDWMFRPRMPQEVEIATGGGVPYCQGPIRSTRSASSAVAASRASAPRRASGSRGATATCPATTRPSSSSRRAIRASSFTTATAISPRRSF